MKILLLIHALLIYNLCIAQIKIDHKKAWENTLDNNVIGKELIFSKSKPNYYDSLVLVYLGTVKTNDGRIFKIITSKWLWGLSPRATNRIIFFNNKNQYVGNYNVTMTYDLPDKIKNNSLIFSNKKKVHCNSQLVNEINFTNGIPKQIFLKCEDESGDIYNFEY